MSNRAPQLDSCRIDRGAEGRFDRNIANGFVKTHGGNSPPRLDGGWNTIHAVFPLKVPSSSRTTVPHRIRSRGIGERSGIIFLQFILGAIA